MLLADHTMRELVEVFGAPQVRPEQMSDEEFYAWLDDDMNDVEMTRAEIDSDDSGVPLFGEL